MRPITEDTRRCNQCWGWQPVSEFKGPRPNHVYQDCRTCRARKGQPIADHRTGLPRSSPLRVSFTRRSKNVKLGPIPSCRVTASTCPPSCSQYNAGCFGESHQLREWWRKVETEGTTWEELCAFVASLPADQVWRYAEVGDLPGEGESVDMYELRKLVEANRGRRGFAYTHKHSAAALEAAQWATAAGFSVNLSADNLAQADELAQWGPVAVILPRDTPVCTFTSQGRPVLVCPAERIGHMTCARCELCASSASGRPIIGFVAHGLRAREVSDRATLRVLT